MNLYKLVEKLVLISLLTGCTQYIVLFRPPKNMDPVPMVEADVKVSETDSKKVSWSMEAVGLNEKYLAEEQDLKGNVNVKVAILSTGIDYNHEDLVGQVLVNREEITEAVDINPSVNYKDDDGNGVVDDIVGWDVVDNDGLAYDRHGAGTAVAGIIAAKANNYGVRGMLEKVSLVPIRYINENGQSDVSKLVTALEVALKREPDVVFLQSIDLPAGGGIMMNPEVMGFESQMIGSVLAKYAKTEIPIVVAAGENLSDFEDLPFGKSFSRTKNVFVVTSTDQKGRLSLLANRGNRSIITAAPGDKILTTGLNNTYEEVRGTAFAAAHVAGAMALAKSKYGENLKVKHLKQVLATPRAQTPSDYIEYQVRSGGTLNVPKFMTALDELVN